ncbi:MAG: DUF5672 family protein [Cytophagales bacterium]|nr:hypothetical protein [Bernardetiaceae bacterium]MDW8211320.1 DUF5672 family protein [Cytophagales bacterium]
MNNLVPAIFVPAYKSQLSKSELISFRQLLKVLGKYPIYMFHPEHLPLENYQKIIATFPNLQVRYQAWPAYFFQNPATYSEMLKDVAFYNFFIQRGHDYLLIYQLDAYVFRDELMEWIQKGYDYIGAPWFSNYTEASPDDEIIGVGNGGFSLRRISTAIKVLQKWHRFQKRYTWLGKWLRQDRAFHLAKWSMGIYTQEDISVILLKNVTEDCFWTEYLTKAFPLRIAPPEEAMFFSFEANPSQLYEKTGKRLPFGCHAWERYEPAFWRQFIDVENEK